MAENTKIRKRGPIFGVRYAQIFLLFLCLVVNIIDQLKISFALFVMTGCELSSPKIKWTKPQRGRIVSSFYWGMIPTQFVGDFLCQKYGVKLTILISTLGSGILNFLIPLLVPLGGWRMYITITIFQGIFQSLFTPCIHNHITKWATAKEQKRLEALSFSGVEVGTILAMGLPGLIARSSLGWQGISYVSGGLSIAWCIVWTIFADNSPTDSKCISAEEKEFLLTSKKQIDDENKKIAIPFKEILTCVPFLSLLVIECALALSFKIIQNEMPSYMRGILRMKIESNSLFSALPYLCRFIVNCLSLFLGDLLIKKNIMSLTNLQKMTSTISTWIPASTLLLLGILDKKYKPLNLVLMIITVGITGGKSIGSGLSASNLSPNHVATLRAITRTACSVIFTLAPILSAVILNEGLELSDWRTLFTITALILFVTNFQFICLGKAEIQPWDDANFGKKEDNIQEEPTSTATNGESDGSHKNRQQSGRVILTVR